MKTHLESLFQNKSYAIHSITPQTSIIECAIQMSRMNIGTFVVMDGKKLIGIISERDIIQKFVAFGCETYLTVADLMIKNPVTAPSSMTVIEAIYLAVQQRLSYLPVVKEEGELIGIISIGDLAACIAKKTGSS